ncbi:MAG TPA: disulfide bond formation protein B [Caulobacteraceae bacterium]
MTRLARNWPWVALLASAALLAVAHAFETFGHLAPCELCLKQREIYWLVMALAAAGLLWRGLGRGFEPTRLINILLLGAFLAETAMAVYHAGVEWKFWPGPLSCSGGSMKVDPAELNRLLSGAKMAIPACDHPAWVFLGLSMAGWNALAAGALAVGSATAALRPPADTDA